MDRKIALISIIVINSLFLIKKSKAIDLSVNCTVICDQVQNVFYDDQIECNLLCRKESCDDGCFNWRKSINSSCQNVCREEGGWHDNGNVGCTLGCVMAAQTYSNKVKEIIGESAAPQLISGSLSATSVGLRWKATSELPQVRYLVQYRQGTGSGEWYYYQPENLLNQTEIIVNNLKPYTKYQFRVAWIIFPDQTPFYSVVSPRISTLPSGPPQSPPTNARAVALDSSRIEVAWDAPDFPGGVLITYTIYLKSANGTNEVRKDLSVEEERNFIVTELSANTTYEIKVTATNHNGEGPPAQVQATTYPSVPAIEDRKGFLLLSSGSKVLKLGLDIMEQPTVIFNTSSNANITGLAVHIPLNLVYVCDSEGFLYQLHLTTGNQRVLMTKEKLRGAPVGLSVDWLFGFLYIVAKSTSNNHRVKDFQIWRCDLMGNHLSLIVAGLPYHPSNIQADPYNGYLWWISNKIESGVHRLLIKHDEQSDDTSSSRVVYRHDNLGGLALDAQNFRVLVADQTKNTILEVSLDGTSVRDLRNNTQQPFFDHVVSLAFINGKFFWTNSREVFAEELNDNTFYHNSYAFFSTDPFLHLVSVHQLGQPFPVPLTFPLKVQALFTRNSATITWEPPKTPPLMGEGAWQEWKYEVHVKEGKKLIYKTGIIQNTIFISNLTPATIYNIKVRAYSKSGEGPWSRTFRGRSLSSSYAEDKLLWSTDEELIVTNLDGQNYSVINTQRRLKNEITHITFFDDMLIASSLNDSCLVINASTGRINQLHRMNGVYATAVDWATNRVFGVEPQNNSIIWHSLSSNASGVLGLLTPALELKIDSFRGLLYWRTRYEVFKSSLAGKNVTRIHQENIFSERLVFGLALNCNKSELWWVVKNKDGCQLHSQLTEETNLILSSQKYIPYCLKEGSLFYLSERLIWLTTEGELIIYDTVLDSTSTIRSNKLEIHLIAVKMHFPYGYDFVNQGFIPTSVDASSVRTRGNWKEFFIIWDPLKSPPLNKMNSNLVTKMSFPFYGDLRYQVTILGQNEKGTYVIKETRVMVPWLVYPHSPLTVIIKGITNWGEGESAVVHLRSPSAIPTRPINLRAFIHYFDDSASVTMRWDPPTRPNGEIEKYRVNQCVAKASECSSFYTNSTHREMFFISEEIYKETTFEITAFTYVGEGPSSIIKLNSTDTLTTIPNLLISTTSTVMKFDADMNSSTEILSGMYSSSSVRSFIYQEEGETLIWMDSHFDLFVKQIKNDKIERFFRMEGNGNFLAFDWIKNVLFWIEDMPDGSKFIIMFDIHFKIEKRLFDISHVQFLPENLMVLPSLDLIYVMGKVEETFSVKVFDLKENKMFDLFDAPKRNESRECSCPKSPSLAKGIAVDSSSLESPSIYINLKKKSFEGHPESSVLLVDPEGCSCESVALLRNFGHDWCDLLSVDKSYIYCFENSRNSLIWFRKDRFETDVDFHRIQLEFHPQTILPFTHNIQPMPKLTCLIVSSDTLKPSIIKSRETSLTIRVPNPPAPKKECHISTLPTWKAVLYYNEVSNANSTSCAQNIKLCHQLKSTNETITINGLSPFTTYVIRIEFETFYNKKFNVPVQAGPPTFFKTKAKAPGGANSVTATPISPEEVKISFEGSIGTPFELHWRSHELVREFLRVTPNAEGGLKRTVILRTLKPNTFYQIWVRMYSNEDTELFTDSPKVSAVTFPEPPGLALVEKETHFLRVQWVSPSTPHILRHFIEYQRHGDLGWNSTNVEESIPSHTYFYDIGHLVPASSYIFRMNIIYNTSEYNSFTWPKDDRFRFNTSGDSPTAPGAVWLQQSDLGPPGVGWKAWWGESNPNGSPLLAYELQVALQETEFEDYDNLTFTTVYNGTVNFWVINLSDFDASSKYVFRVRGINALGMSKWSSQNMVMPLVSSSKLDAVHLPTILGATIPSFIMFFIILLACLTISIRRADSKRRKAKSISLATQSSSRAREVELASLPNHFPHNNNFVSEENILYSMHSFPGDEIDLPHVSRHCITLTKFLGSGAFGEVFEGTATSLPGWPGVTKIAIKTLRKGASENEKCEFVKEAQLMSHFQHDHILRLLAVCTDNDPFFLILELMEGGDLLSYLRANRGVESGFTLLDLLRMCVDVAKGCVYLEEMHFVHRDLAARNCLVSSTNPSQRIVKIGDFGLARDIYKNDYYRKEGEGLLPVRWMSPESLIDGVFTTQSDVWAFGVLLWEILTLGQQPYPARTNLEVLHYVRNGGMPSRPPICPDDLYNLTLRCWSYNAEGRPTFKECLSVLLVLEETSAACPALAVHNVNYMSFNGPGLDNFAYNGDRDDVSHRKTGPLLLPETSWDSRRGTEGESASGASTIPLNSPLRRQQQYFQLINDQAQSTDSTITASMLDSDSYERPITLLNRRLEPSRRCNREFRPMNENLFVNLPNVTQRPLDSSVYSESSSVSEENNAAIEVPPRSVDNNSEIPATPLLNPTYCTSQMNSEIVILSASNKNSPGYDYCHPLPSEIAFSNCSELSNSATSFGRKNSLPNLTSMSNRRKPSLSSLPSSPLSPSQTVSLLSENIDSPMSLTFTFPTPTSKDSNSMNEYLKPVDKSAEETAITKSVVRRLYSSSETLDFNEISPTVSDISPKEIKDSPKDKTPFSSMSSGYDSYISMSGGHSSSPHQNKGSKLKIVSINGMIPSEPLSNKLSLQHVTKSVSRLESVALLQENRTKSEISPLPNVNGTTSSSFNIDYTPTQSYC